MIAKPPTSQNWKEKPWASSPFNAQEFFFLNNN
jgi:hypothetical protein